MTASQIEKRATKEMVPFQVAKQIRELLDTARKAYGAEDWAADDCETKIQELVFED